MSKNRVITCLIFAFIASIISVKAQLNEEFVNKKLVKKDVFIIDAFFGWPYLNGTLLTAVSNNVKVKNTNHLGGKFEYMISDEVGLGGEFTYADASVNYNASSTGNTQRAGVSKLRILGRVNYHFQTSELFDLYLGMGIGYKKTTYYDTGNSNYNQTFNLFPISMKLAIGVHYYFNETIGINTEVGLGGPLISAGLSVKL
jgi:hypothetical protein